eukprot:TRINITY_DN21519_c0_g1_i1.p1 TRINITY_DN21519_c0_g1~~TRINITY_DN21519_c0_g1_i1.p1  ORF type:complete len:407 (-),score=78.38 TRINITY_DN21519_c0_g1_i1:49-1269(-)
MSQARHVNCKWQLKTDRNSKDVRSKADKFRSDKLAMDMPAGISKDELVKYFKKYGKVVAAREFNSQLIVQMESHEPVDLAIELQAINEHEAKGISFQVRRWNATDDEIRMWEEKSGMKRKAGLPDIERPEIKSAKVATAPGPVPVETPSLILSQPRGERNQFGHLPGCECKTCKLLGDELAKLQAKQEQKSVAAAAGDTPAAPAPPEPAAVPDTTEYNPFVEEEWVEPVAPQWAEPQWAEPPPNPFGHLQGCICPKCRKWAAGVSVETIMHEEASKRQAKQSGTAAESFAPQTQEIAGSGGNGAGYLSSGQGRSVGIGMLTGDSHDNASSMTAMAAMSTMMSAMSSAVSAMPWTPGPTGHLPGCLCKTCRGGSGLAPTQKQPKPQPVMPAKGKHLPGCFCPACKQG